MSGWSGLAIMLAVAVFVPFVVYGLVRFLVWTDPGRDPGPPDPRKLVWSRGWTAVAYLSIGLSYLLEDDRPLAFAAPWLFLSAVFMAWTLQTWRRQRAGA